MHRRALRLTFSVALLCGAALAQSVTQFSILPFAGMRRDLGDNGPAIAALLNAPHGVAVDQSGNVYIADTSDNLLRRVSSSGTITTVTDQLLSPWSAAAGPTGDLYITDTANNRVLKVSSTGAVNAFASGAQLISPRDVVVDGAGNVFILDTGNHRVLKATPDGKTMPYAGTGAPGFFGDGGPAAQALLDFPYGIALDAAGDLFISDSLNQRIRVVTPDGNIATVASGFKYPAGIVVDSSGSLYIADTGNHSIRKIVQPLGTNVQVTTFAGIGTAGYSGDGGPAASAQLNSPYGVAIDPQMGILVADSGNNRIRRIDVHGVINTVAGADHASGDNGPALSARLFGPSGIAIDGTGNVYIADTNNNRIRRVATDGTIATVVTNLNAPNGVAFDSAGALYFADTNAHVIRKLEGGRLSIAAGVPGVSGNDGDEQPAASAHLENPNALAFDRAGDLYIADSGNNRVRVVTRDGIIHGFAGDAQKGLPGFDGDNGPAVSAHLKYPRGLAVDSNGNAYIADYFNDRVRMVSAVSRNITTVAGTGVRGGAGEGGAATQAQLALPSGLAFDRSGNLYIADSLNNRIRVLKSDGTLSSVAGGSGPGDTGDGGPAVGALIAFPRDVAVDATGIIYFSDQDNDRVRKLVPGRVAISRIVNAASNAGGGLAPGEIVTVFGTQLTTAGTASSVPATATALATTAANTRVLFDGIAAPLLYVSTNQINAIVPYEVSGRDSTSVVVESQGQRSDAMTIPVAPSAPGLFGVAVNQDGSQNTPTHPAHVGEVIVVFATGEGQTNPPGVTGQLANGSTLPAPVLPVSVQIGNQPAQLEYAAAMPHGAGVLQINAIIPEGIAPGDGVPLVLTIGSVQAQSAISVQ